MQESIANMDPDWSLEPKCLRLLYKETSFDSTFYKLISKDVIQSLSPQSLAEPYNLVYDDNRVYTTLLEPLEKFICGLKESDTQDDVKAAFEHLETLNQPSKICRRVFKTGDVTFACNDCGQDETCVVCIDCFHKGRHKDHNYRMNASGGGCCDCGDVEAWKQNHACTDHLASNQATSSLSDFETKDLRTKQLNADKKNILKRLALLPEGVASRYFSVCQASLHYARMMLNWNNFDSLPQCLEVVDPEIDQLLSKETTSRNYFTVVYNDEVHTYDFVITTFVKHIKCTKMQAGIMAATVSREGRSFIVNDTEKACKSVRDLIANQRDTGQNALKVEVIHGAILAHQAFALKLIEWIRKMSTFCDAFRILTAYTLLGQFEPIPECDETPDQHVTLVEKIMCYNTKYWKIVRVEWNDLFVVSLLTEYSLKDQFARILTRIYPKLMHDFILDDHDHSVSILTMTTQLYTVPSLVCMLIEEENALAIIIHTFLDVTKRSKRDPALAFENRKTFDMSNLKRGFYMIKDLQNLINIQPTKWTDELRGSVVEAVNIFSAVLSVMQGMDSARRQLGQHLEYEPDWETGVDLQARLTPFISRFVTYCSYDERVLVEALKETQKKLLKISLFKYTSKDLFDHQINCIQYDVSVSPVSIHLPLTRFAAALVVELMARRPSDKTPYDQSLVILTDHHSSDNAARKYSMIDMMEPSLRTEVLVAQWRSGMWRRNGYSLTNQMLYFHGATMRKEMLDRDILLLQEAGAMCNANEFMMHLLNKFNLFTWLNSDTIREPLVGPRAVSFTNDEEQMAQTMSLGEEFLQLLLTIISERYRKGVGLVEEVDIIKNEMIHLLCISPATRSDIIIKLGLNENEVDCIKAVANLRRSTESSAGKYELKDEFYDYFNPFFYHYSRRHQASAIDAQLKRKKNLKEPLCCPPPQPVQLVDQFANLNELLKCDITLNLIAIILKRALGPPEDAQECSTKAPIRFLASDLQLDHCLHLIGIGLFEQKRDPENFKYLQAAQERNIPFLLKECYEKAQRSKDLIDWVMKTANELVSTMTIEDSALSSIREHLNSASSSRDSIRQDSKKKSSELAAQRRERIMSQMKANQDKFLSNQSTTQDMLELDNDDYPMDCNVSPKQPETRHLCILCRGDQTVGFDQPTMVSLAFVQRSAVLSKNRGQRRIPNYALTPSNQASMTLPNQPFFQGTFSSSKHSFTTDNSLFFDASIMPADLFFGPHISTCGHVMHHDCWKEFFNAVMKRETSRPNRNARHIAFDLEKHEFLCPLCEFICNVTIPLLPNYTNFAKRRTDSVFAVSREVIAKSSEKLSACLLALRSTVDVYERVRQLEDKSTKVGSQKYVKVMIPRDINEVLQELNEIEALGLRDFINSTRVDKLSSSICSRSLLSSISILAERINTLGLDFDKKVGNIQHDKIFMMTSWTISYTIQAYEQAARYKGSPIFLDLESPKNHCLSSLLRCACASMLTHHPDLMQSLLIKKLKYLLINEEHLSSSPCCLDIDALEMFVSLFILMQKLYTHIDDPVQEKNVTYEQKPCSSDSSYAWTTCNFNHEFYRNLLHLMLLLNALQVILSMQNELIDTNEEKTNNEEEDAKEADVEPHLKTFYREVLIASGHPVKKMLPVDAEFCSNLRRRLLPFLRSCAVFFYHLSHIPPPESLRLKSAFFEGASAGVNYETSNEEFEAVCQYLNLPNDFSILFQSLEARHLARSWLRHPRILILIRSAMRETTREEEITTRNNSDDSELMPVKLVRQPHFVNRLIELPYDYSELVDKVSNFTCPSIKNEDARTPTLCLVCGVMLCSHAYCCQRDLNELASNYQRTRQLKCDMTENGASSSASELAARMIALPQQLVGSCTYHAHECSAGVGVFLRIRSCQVLLLSGRSKGCYMPAPYIDDHGEPDFGLLRGNPLHLNREHVEKLQQMWLTHAIPEYISRALERSPFASSLAWHLH